MFMDKKLIADKIEECRQLFLDENYGEAFNVSSGHLNQHPDESVFLSLSAQSLLQNERWGLAANILKRGLQIEPGIAVMWNNLGYCLMHLGHEGQEHLLPQAKTCIERAIEINPNDPDFYNNLCIMALHECETREAVAYGEKAQLAEPGFAAAFYNMALAYLMDGNWPMGWRYYDFGIKGRFKKDSRYNLPKWDGRPGQRVIVYGEQGLGDEIMFASMLPDMARECRVIADCDSRLAGLYERSFDVTAHGTRYNREADWEIDADAQIPIGSLGKFYRTRTEDFPGTPYLLPDPERRMQYRALLDSLGPKPKIGLAWSGGIKKTFDYRRSLDLDALKPILEHDADFISLQYKDPPEDSRVTHWPNIVEAKDYDETAALVAELDLVITVTTTTAHLCGALGTECWVLVPDRPQWRYMREGDRIPWYDSVEIFRKDGEWPIKEISHRLSLRGIAKPRKPSMNRTVTVSPQHITAPLSAVS